MNEVANLSIVSLLTMQTAIGRLSKGVEIEKINVGWLNLSRDAVESINNWCLCQGIFFESLSNWGPIIGIMSWWHSSYSS